MTDTILKMKGIKKVFPGVVALSGVDLELEKGQVLALLGENGAGKSTLMKILSGSYKPDGGEIFIKGKKVEIKNVNDAKELGISIIYQELSLCPNLTVAENIYAFQEPTRFGLIDDRKMISMTQALFDELEIDIDPKAVVKDLSISNQQMVEIAKALSTKPDIIIMDEPTSALSSKETEKLFKIISKYKSEGTAMVYISHRMEEIFAITDIIMVLRDGQYIGTVETALTTSEELIKMMVGREMDQVYPHKDFSYTKDEKLFEIKNYTKNKFFYDINLYVRPGEILGLYGLMGSGRTEIAKGIFGILKKDSGEMCLHGKPVKVNDPYSAIENNIAFVTEDRKHEGLVLTAGVYENITMANLSSLLTKFRLLDTQKEINITEKQIDDLRIKTPSFKQTVNKLSGGNQQKIVLAKWFETEPEVLILDEPTRGIDVGAKYEIYKLMIDLARKGVGIIIISSDLPEILNVSDRLLVINKKRIIAELDPKSTTQEEIMTHIIGRGDQFGQAKQSDKE
ncbi:sugar ABC transporter ATP-binding protein [Heliorestis acidaminivorans]|uniref:Sugar ABC transporter ATP-binding protein n=1 Tax=Heliorestis acidaminivorans TaxID=553427 RepID=A0A6I0ERD8_9FIRM|nr:sugar ABC transporter ATP-binding protein [Heliorestis acidaminivorans]KAB2952106.1 sugar ABC transporter ATP-binding protein [Heliorestis acidaminivorans]